MAELKTLEIKSNEVDSLTYRASFMHSLAGTAVVNKYKPMKIAKRQEPYTIKIPLNATTRLGTFKSATTLKRITLTS